MCALPGSRLLVTPVFLLSGFGVLKLIYWHTDPVIA